MEKACLGWVKASYFAEKSGKIHAFIYLFIMAPSMYAELQTIMSLEHICTGIIIALYNNLKPVTL